MPKNKKAEHRRPGSTPFLVFLIIYYRLIRLSEALTKRLR